MKKASSTIAQAKSRQAIWMKFSKKDDVAHQVARSIRACGRPASSPACATLARAAADRRRKARARGLKAEAGEALEDDARRDCSSCR